MSARWSGCRVRDDDKAVRDEGRRGDSRIVAGRGGDAQPWAVAFWRAVGYADDARIARYVRNFGSAEG